MWPFKKKKEEENNQNKKKIEDHKHNLPNLPDMKEKSKGFPSYEHELGEIKRAIDKPIPKYEGGLSNIKKSIEQNISAKGEPLNLPKRKPSFLKNIPKTKEASLPHLREISERDTTEVNSDEITSKPIFVKLNNYKSAKSSLNKIKNLTKDAENLLLELNQTREEEDKELNKWKADIEKIKDNLLTIDKKMFEL